MSRKSKIRQIMKKGPAKPVKKHHRRADMSDRDEYFVEDRGAKPVDMARYSKKPEPPASAKPTAPSYKGSRIQIDAIAAQLGADPSIESKLSLKKRMAEIQKEEDRLPVAVYDVWGAPSDPAASPPTRKVGEPVRSVAEILTSKPTLPVDAPSTAVSYNPTFSAQQHAIEKEAARLEKINAQVDAQRTARYIPPSRTERQELVRQEFIQSMKTASLPVDAPAAENDAHCAQEPDPSSNDDSADAALTVPRKLDRLKIKAGIANLEKELVAIDRQIQRELREQFVNELQTKEGAEDEGATGAFVVKRRPLRRKLRQPGTTLPEVPVSDVPLMEECNGSLRRLHPQGNLFRERWLSAQRRNIIETLKTRKGAAKKRPLRVKFT